MPLIEPVPQPAHNTKPVVVGNRLYVGSTDGSLYVLAPEPKK